MDHSSCLQLELERWVLVGLGKGTHVQNQIKLKVVTFWRMAIYESAGHWGPLLMVPLLCSPKDTLCIFDVLPPPSRDRDLSFILAWEQTPPLSPSPPLLEALLFSVMTF